MVRISFDQKPYRKAMMETWGGQCIASPSTETKAGRDALERDPDTPGSLGIAISEAVEAAVSDTSGKTRYSLGSVLNHVMLHQTIIGLEAKNSSKWPATIRISSSAAPAAAATSPAWPFPSSWTKSTARDRDLPGGAQGLPHHDPGAFAYDHGDTAGIHPAAAHAQPGAQLRAGADPRRRPALPRHGAHRQPAGQRGPADAQIGGPDGCLRGRYPVGPDRGVHPRAGNHQRPGPGGGRSQKAKEEGKEKTIVVNFSGHGLLDLGAYDKYFSGELFDYSLDDAEIEKSTEVLKNYPTPQDIKSV
jgi:tryptophan synthase beta chain